MHAGLDRGSQGRRSGWRASGQAFPLGWERFECRLRQKAKGTRTSGLERIEKVRQVSAGKADVTAVGNAVDGAGNLVAKKPKELFDRVLEGVKAGLD